MTRPCGDSSLRNNALYHNNGDGTFTKITTGSPVNDKARCASASWGDYNKDGFPDLVIANYGERNFLYQNNGNGNNWLTIDCSARLSNRSAIGAKLRVKATIHGKTYWQLRLISNGDGLSGDRLQAHFRLGDATSVEALRVEWPSGIVQELTNIAPNQFLAVRESGVAVVPRVQNMGVGSNHVFTAQSTFTNVLTYQWQFYDVDMPGETNRTLSVAGGGSVTSRGIQRAGYAIGRRKRGGQYRGFAALGRCAGHLYPAATSHCRKWHGRSYFRRDTSKQPP